MKTHRYALLWWSVRLYAVGFAAFIAAFGTFGWRLPAYRRRYEEIGRGDVQRRDDASGADPSYRASYRPDVPIATSSPLRSWGIAMAFVAAMVAIWLAITVFA